MCGHHAAHESLERELAEWLGAPKALLFGSGYLANLAVMQALLDDGDVCVQDRLNHASLIDGARLAGCRLRRYPHADPEGALRQLRSAPDGAALLATDGVFSMDGDNAPLRELALVARVQRAMLYVDDAHGVGVVGPDGRGSVAAANLEGEDAPLQLATLGKALGGYGAVGPQRGRDQQPRRTARPTSIRRIAAAQPRLRCGGEIGAPRNWRREKLQALASRLRGAARGRDLELLPSSTPIQPLLCGDEMRALAMSAALEVQGFWVPAIRPPTVPEGSARLRITLSALHTPTEIDALIDAIAWAREAVELGFGATA